ncbi:MAG: amidohydrolase family protein [Polaromonas sp.]|nr:amidohydrolase family protein [Polaromonas sp.]
MLPYLDWQRGTRAPDLRLPPLSCDCAIHVFDAAHAHRLLAGRRYDPPAASLQDLQAMHKRLGIERAVLVQASVYGSDHTVLLRALRADPGRYRGVALLDASISDADCADMHAAGVRSARFNILSRFGAAFDTTAFLREVRRAEELGWSLSLHASADELAVHAPMLLKLDTPIVIDHLAYLSPAQIPGVGFDFVCEALARGNWWVKVSRMDHRSHPPYSEMAALASQVIALRPDRMVWATDWPHPLYDAATCTMPNDADLVELFARSVPDAAVREQILVRNPSTLFDFPAA